VPYSKRWNMHCSILRPVVSFYRTVPGTRNKPVTVISRTFLHYRCINCCKLRLSLCKSDVNRSKCNNESLCSGPLCLIANSSSIHQVNWYIYGRRFKRDDWRNAACRHKTDVRRPRVRRSLHRYNATLVARRRIRTVSYCFMTSLS